jgi:hypothetical protein
MKNKPKTPEYTEINLKVTEEEKDLILSLLGSSGVQAFAKENLKIDLNGVLERTYPFPTLLASRRTSWWGLIL